MKKYINFSAIFLTLIATSAVNTFAALEITASANRDTIALNEQVEISVSISGDTKKIPKPKIPDLDNFRIAGSGRSQSISIVNGRVSSSMMFKYALYPKKTGDFTVPPFSVNYRGKNYLTSPIKIRVTDAAKRSPVRDESGPAAADGLFVSQQVDKEEAYLGEQITYTFKFYRRVKLLRNPSFQPPSFAGFFSDEMPPNRNYRARRRDAEYAVTEIKYAIFAQRSGKITIEPAAVTVAVADTGGGDFFDSFFSQGKRKVLRGKPLKINILPLPEGAPESFTGAVGKFNISAGLKKDNVKQGNPVSLEIKISGRGDLRPVKQPEISGLNNFKVYESVSSENIEKKNYKITGSKSFTTLIMPSVSGRLGVPPVSFSYFEPEDVEYKNLKTETLYLNVTPSKEKMPETEESATSRLRVEREDIRYITFSNGRIKKTLLFNKKGFWAVVLIPVYLWIAALIVTLIKIKLSPGRAARERRKKLQQLLKEAGKCAASGDDVGIYRKIEEVSQIVEIRDKKAAEISDRAKEALYSPQKDFAGSAKTDLKIFSRAVKKILLFLVVSFSLITGSASAGRFETANNAYKEGNYHQASEIYSRIIADGRNSEGVFYNLGNAYWRMGETGRARLYWEKALKINPSNRDAAYNIGLIKKTIGEDSGESSAAAVTRICSKIMGLNAMTVTVSVAAWAALLFFLGYYLRRREGFIWAGAASLVIFLILLAGLLTRLEVQLKSSRGIILRKTSIYSAPGTIADAQGTVPEGKKVVIISETKDWVSAGIPEENIQFWVPVEVIEKIVKTK